MGHIKRICDNTECTTEYMADTRNLKRGWGLCCSKSCAASKREKSKPNYNPDRVKKNNKRRILWNDNIIVNNGKTNICYTSEGYKIIDGIVYDAFGEKMYNTIYEDDDEDPGDSMYWDNKDYGF